MEQNQYYSQFGQDKFIYETFFKGKKGGVFLDIGAHDGIEKSNTYFFEKHMGWNGICVEPMPDVFERLRKNRTSNCVNAGISDKNGKATFWKIEGYSEMLSGLEANYNEQHKLRINKEINEHGGKLNEIEINVFDINTLLKENNVTHINYCSIDVEGSEENIISVLDTKLIEIEVFTIENNYQTRSLRNLMKSKGYRLHSQIDMDDVFIRRKKWFLF